MPPETTNRTDDGEAEAEEATGGSTPRKKGRRRRKGLDMQITKDGTVHIRHCGEGVELDTALLADGSSAPAPVWIQVAKLGAFKGHAAGPFEINASTIQQIVTNFRSTANRRIPVDFEHACEMGATEGSVPQLGAPAQGWITDLDDRGAAGLWGLVEWHEPARSYIREGRYRYISPAIRFSSRDRVTGKPIGARLSSAALTNQPFLDGMAAVAATDVADEDEDDDSASAERAGPEPEEKPTMDAMKLKELEDTTSKLLTQNATLSLQLKDAEARASAAEQEVKTLRDWKSEREDKDLSDEVEIAFATYKDAKKLSDSDKEAMLLTLKAAPEAFRKLYPAVPADKRHLLSRVGGSGRQPTTGGGLGSGVPVQTGNVLTLADRIQKENPKLSREDAIIHADIQMRAASRRVGG